MMVELSYVQETTLPEQFEASAEGKEVEKELTLLEPINAEAATPSSEQSFVHIYEDLQEESKALESQVSALKRTLAQLRLSVSIIEGQRTEFKGFLDGSK